MSSEVPSAQCPIGHLWTPEPDSELERQCKEAGALMVLPNACPQCKEESSHAAAQG